MATSIYINTDLKDLTANAVANINRPTQVVRLPQIVEGEVVDVVLHLVKSNGAYDSRSGSGSSVSVAISSRGKAATSGTFTLNAGTATTGALAWNASAEAVEGALNALNGGAGAFGSKVKVTKLGAGSYRVIFDTVGARTDMAGTSLDLGPESEVTAATSVVGTSTIRAQQVIEISQQPAIYTETWTAVGSTWSGQLNANTARVQELIAEGAGAFFEVKIGSDVVCQVPISVLSAVAAPNSLPAHELPGNLDAFAADPSTNGSFNPANWREDLSLNNYAPINDATFTGTTTIPSADITTADFNAAGLGGEVSWNNQEKTLDLVTGSDNVTIQLGQEVVLYARNNSGATLSDGNVVMISGSQGNKPTISLAQADTVANARKTIGVVTQSIPNNSNGFVTLIGKVRDLVLDNGTYSEGDVVYLSDTVAGGLTVVEPSISVEVGHVLATSNGGNTNGVLEVQINNGAGTYELEQTLNAAIATKAPIASPTFTGDLTVGNIEIGQSSSSTVVNLLSASNESGARTSIGLGAADIVEFGGFVAPAGTTAEINAVTTATVGQVIIDTDRNRSVRFTSANTYDVIGYTSSSTYYVDPQNGNDSTGAVGGLSFATINAALTQAVADSSSPIIVRCLSGFYSETDAFNGISTSANVAIKFDIGSVYFNASMTSPFFDTTTATIPALIYVGGNLLWNSGDFGFFKGTTSINNAVNTTLEVQGIGSAPTSSPMFEITGGQADILIKGLAYYGSAGNVQPIIDASGNAKVKCVGLNAFYAIPIASPVLPATKLSGTATLKLSNVSVQNAGLCEITSDTACKLIIRDCNCSDGFFPGATLTVKAPAGSTNPKAFALGVNAVPAAATNITVDVTFGQFIADASADDLF